MMIGGAAAQSPTIAVDDPRPLAQTVDRFERMYGVVVTYEDPRVVDPADLITRSYRGVTEVIPRGGPFTATIDTALRSSAAAPEIAECIRRIVAQYHASGYPGRFDVVESVGVVNVVPAAVRGPAGVLVTASSA